MSLLHGTVDEVRLVAASSHQIQIHHGRQADQDPPGPDPAPEPTEDLRFLEGHFPQNVHPPLRRRATLGLLRCPTILTTNFTFAARC